MISIRRIKGILLEEFFIIRKSLEIFFDIPFFSITGIILFGFLASFISKALGTVGSSYLLMGYILWEALRITQYSMSVGSLWEIWSRNLSNLFVTPLKISEYFIAVILSATIKVFVVCSTLSILTIYFFGFNIFEVGLLNLLLFFANLIFFGFSTGIIILGLIFRFSTRVQAIAWGFIFLFQPLTAVFYPVSVLPKPIQTFAFMFPPTYVFEAAREVLRTGILNQEYMNLAFILNTIYFVAAIILFAYLFKKSKDIGQFARNEG